MAILECGACRLRRATVTRWSTQFILFSGSVDQASSETLNLFSICPRNGCVGSE